jgi:alpha,alpha-trehalase
MSTWTLRYEGYVPEEEMLREALCVVGNGYFATRGAAPESTADGTHYPGTYVAGLFNRLTDAIEGKDIVNESMVNVPNWLPLTFSIEGGAWFDIDEVEILEYAQELEIREGVLKRHVRFRDAEGRTTLLAQRRFVHIAHRHLAALETTVKAEDWSGTVRFRTAIDGSVENRGVARYNDLSSDHLETIHAAGDEASPDIIHLLAETNQSHVRISTAARTRAFKGDVELEPARELLLEEEYVAQEFDVELGQDEAVSIEKIVSLFTSRDKAISEPCLESRKHLRRCRRFDETLQYHILTWDHLWERFKISVCNHDDTAQMALNLHILHLLQSVSPNSIDLDVGVPARGLHGEAYRGHIFWDEIFIFPFINFRLPELTRSLLQYRYRRINEARYRAYDEGLQGALYPWQSGSNGKEESQEWHLNPESGEWIEDNSHLQRHINIAIAYNVWYYYQVTGDLGFMSFQGTEMMVEIARFFASIATYDHAEDRYDILGVMGPDEYHDAYPDAEKPGLDNNAYTNVMAAWCARKAIESLEILTPHRHRELWDKLALEREELELWDRLTRRLKVPFHDDEESGRIISQFEGYGDLEEFDWMGYARKYGDIQRLDRILNAEGDSTNKYKLSKQADVLMLFYLLSEGQLQELFEDLGYEWADDLVERNIDYYMVRTSHGSTLSRLVHSWVLARKDPARSWEFFTEALLSDITDIQGGTTSEGVHLGAMAGTVDLAQRGYTGIEPRGDTLWFDPALPDELDCVRMMIRYRAMWLDVEITHEHVKIASDLEDDGVCCVGLGEEMFEIEPGKTVILSLEKK